MSNHLTYESRLENYLLDHYEPETAHDLQREVQLGKISCQCLLEICESVDNDRRLKDWKLERQSVADQYSEASRDNVIALHKE